MIVTYMCTSKSLKLAYNTGFCVQNNHLNLREEGEKYVEMFFFVVEKQALSVGILRLFELKPTYCISQKIPN